MGVAQHVLLSLLFLWHYIDISKYMINFKHLFTCRMNSENGPMICYINEFVVGEHKNGKQRSTTLLNDWCRWSERCRPAICVAVGLSIIRCFDLFVLFW